MFSDESGDDEVFESQQQQTQNYYLDEVDDESWLLPSRKFWLLVKYIALINFVFEMFTHHPEFRYTFIHIIENSLVSLSPYMIII